MRVLLALIALIFCSAQSDPILVPEVSQDEIRVRQGFTGQELLLFGAILEPDGRRAGQEYEIVVVLKGPTEPIRLREKQRIAAAFAAHGPSTRPGSLVEVFLGKVGKGVAVQRGLLGGEVGATGGVVQVEDKVLEGGGKTGVVRVGRCRGRSGSSGAHDGRRCRGVLWLLMSRRREIHVRGRSIK